MVSLRSGSTTDAHNGEPNALTEVSSKLSGRQRAKKSLPAPQVAAAEAETSGARKPTGHNGVNPPLAAIAEAPSADTPAGEEAGVSGGAAGLSAPEQSLKRQPSDPPARHTRASSRHQAHAACEMTGLDSSVAHPQLPRSSRPEEVAFEGSDDAQCSDGEEGEDEEAEGSGERALGEAAAGTGVVWTTSEEEGEEGEDDEDSDSEDEEEGVGRGRLGQMAQSMLAALGSLGAPSMYGSAAPAGPARSLPGIRGGAGALATAGPVREDAGEEAGLDEMRWEPALQLPPPAGAAEAARMPAAALAKAEVLPGKQLTAPPRDARRQAREARKAAPDTAGRRWFDLPATQITDEVKRELRLLRLRGAMDPKRFYKSFDQSKFPKYFQFGTVVEGPADFYAGRMTKRERKRTLTEELLADAELARTRSKRFGALQEERQRWAHRRQQRKNVGYARKKVYKRPRH